MFWILFFILPNVNLLNLTNYRSVSVRKNKAYEFIINFLDFWAKKTPYSRINSINRGILMYK